MAGGWVLVFFEVPENLGFWRLFFDLRQLGDQSTLDCSSFVEVVVLPGSLENMAVFGDILALSVMFPTLEMANIVVAICPYLLP